MSAVDQSVYEERGADPSGVEAEVDGAYSPAPDGGHAPADEEGAGGAASAGAEMVQAAKDSMNRVGGEVMSRAAVVAAEAQRKPWQSTAVGVAVVGFVWALISVTTPWLELHASNTAAGLAVNAHVDLTNVVACRTSPRTELTPGSDCDIYAISVAPRLLDGLGSATTAAAVFAILGLIASGVAGAVTVLRRLDRVRSLGRFAPTVGSKMGCIVEHAIASFCLMLAFSAYCGGVNPILGDNVKLALLLRGTVPTSSWYGAGFAFAILGWLFHAGCAYVVYRTPEAEELSAALADPPVSAGAAMPPARVAEATEDEEEARRATGFSSLTDEVGEAPSPAPFGGSRGVDDDEDSEEAGEGAAAAAGDSGGPAEDDADSRSGEEEEERVDADGDEAIV